MINHASTTRQRARRITIACCAILIIALLGLCFLGNAARQTAVPVASENSPLAVAGSPLHTPSADGAGKDKPAAMAEPTTATAGLAGPIASKKEFELPDSRYAEIIATLKDAAEKGNPDAAYAIARMLVDCKELFVNNDQRLAGGNKPAEPNLSPENKAIIDRMEAGIMEDDTRRLEKCDGITLNDLSRSTDWMQRAADAGLAEARADYGLYAFEGMSMADAIREPEKIIAIKQNYVRYSDEAMATGSISAFLRTANDYSAGSYRPQDYVLAYAYYYAVSLANPAFSNSTLLSHYASRLTPEQLVAAQRQGQVLSRQIR